MVQIIWSKKALRRIDRIALYLVDLQGFDDAGQIFVENIINSTRRLKKFPQSGRIVPEFDDPRLREVFFIKYRIIYEYKQSQVEILTVDHSSRILKL